MSLCLVCNVAMYKKPKETWVAWRNRRYCSNLCWHKSAERYDKIGRLPKTLGKKFSKDTKVKMRNAHLGISTWNKGLQTSPEVKLKLRNLLLGEKNPAWKGGVTPVNKRARKDYRLREWRIKVFTRDDYTCQHCKVRGTQLEAHHVKAFAHYPELRFDLSNGLTLCRDCHQKTPNYKRRSIVEN